MLRLDFSEFQMISFRQRWTVISTQFMLPVHNVAIMYPPSLNAVLLKTIHCTLTLPYIIYIRSLEALCIGRWRKCPELVDLVGLSVFRSQLVLRTGLLLVSWIASSYIVPDAASKHKHITVLDALNFRGMRIYSNWDVAKKDYNHLLIYHYNSQYAFLTHLWIMQTLFTLKVGITQSWPTRDYRCCLLGKAFLTCRPVSVWSISKMSHQLW